MEYYHWYFVVINVVAFLMYGWDKLCACRNWWRLSEFALLFVAALGGGIGASLDAQAAAVILESWFNHPRSLA